MKDFHHNYLCRPTENSRKEQKTSRSHHCSMCKCVKLHYHDCPMIMQPCPLHGSAFQSEERIERADRGQNVIISFHPSSRTERLLQPIKSLLANCKSETKINFQYYTPPNSISSESVRPNYGQNALEQLKRNLNNSIFIDRTKSFVVDKTNKVKKLKECLYSPCGSIARKSLSQTSVKDKLNQALFEDHRDTQNALYKIMSELPPNDLRNDWFYPRKISNEKFPSDFITVTKHDKNNIINHKIFEIKHDTEGEEVPYVGFPKPQNQFVYAAASVKEKPQKAEKAEKTEKSEKPKKKFQLCKKKKKMVDASVGPDSPLTEAESTNVMSTSSGESVYITPFLFVPQVAESSEEIPQSKESQKSDVSRRHGKNVKGVQMEGQSNYEPPSKRTQKNERQNDVILCRPCKCDESKTKSVNLQTESYCPVSSRQTSGVRDPGPKTKIEDIYVERVSNFMKPSDYSQSRQSDPMSSRTSKRSTQNTSAPEDYCHSKAISTQAWWESGMKDQTSQTEELWRFQLVVKTFESKANKSQGTSPRHSERGLQTVYYHRTKPSHNCSEFINIKTPQNCRVKDQYPDSDDSDKVEKIWNGKSHSDSNLFEKGKCGCCRSDSEKDHKRPEKESSQSRDSPREKPSARLSDLSELKKYIRELFQKESLAHKNCLCEKPEKELPPVEYKDTQTPPTNDESVDDKMPTPPHKNSEKTYHAQVQTSGSVDMNKKTNGEAQTDITVLLQESDNESGGPKKIKVCRTAVLDPDNESKTFFICTVCGREITIISKNAATSTIELKSGFTNGPFVKPTQKTTVSETESTKWTETHVEIKKLKKPSKQLQKATVSQTEKEKPPEKPSRVSRNQRNYQKNAIPILVQPIRPRQDSDVLSKDSSKSGENLDEKSPNTRNCECQCFCSPAPSETKSQSDENGVTKQPTGRNTEFFYPVITSRLWPKEFFQSWESIETSLAPSKNQLEQTNQKRTYDKDFESTVFGKRKKVEVEGKTSFTNPSPTVSGLLVKGDDGGYKFWPSSFVDCHDFQSKDDILDENELQDSLSALQLDDILTSARTSEDIITSRSSLLMETEEQQREAPPEEPNVSSLPNRPTVMPQSHSVFNFNSFSNSKVSSNSKSLNAFSFIGGSKKNIGTSLKNSN